MRRTEVRLIKHAQPRAPYLEIARYLPQGADLTESGARTAMRLGAVWSHEGIGITEFHASPLSACVQTAAIAQRSYNPEGRMRVSVLNILDTTAMHNNLVRPGAYQLTHGTTPIEHNTQLVLRTPTSGVLQGAGLMAAYLTGMHTRSAETDRSVVAVTDEASINAVLGLLEVGVGAALSDPEVHLRSTICRQPLEPASETLIVLEGDPDPHRMMGHIEYVGAPVWEMQS